MKPYNSLLSSEDIHIHVPRTDCIGGNCQNDSHTYNTNRKTDTYDTRAQVRFMGEILKPTTHKSKNPSTWELLK
jgi:hypothetical protein